MKKATPLIILVTTIFLAGCTMPWTKTETEVIPNDGGQLPIASGEVSGQATIKTDTTKNLIPSDTPK